MSICRKHTRCERELAEQIKPLTEEITTLRERVKELEARHNRLMTRIMRENFDKLPDADWD